MGASKRCGRMLGRKIIVTGGGSGIGLATARRFMEEGAAVAVLERSLKSLEAARRELEGAAVLECDVSVETSVDNAVKAAASQLGGIDGIANVAGIGTRRSFDETTAAIMMKDFSINLMGPFLVTKAALSFLRAASHGATIVNVASGLALRPTEGRTAYCASKGGLIVMSKAMALDLSKDGIRVNVVCPGLIDTPLISDSSNGPSITPDQIDKLMDRRILRRLGQSREVADAIVFLSSKESSFITASVLAVDGGGSMH